MIGSTLTQPSWEQRMSEKIYIFRGITMGIGSIWESNSSDLYVSLSLSLFVNLGVEKAWSALHLHFKTLKQ